MKVDTPYPIVKPLGTILGVWAHPDDESWSMAGLMMAAIANGQRVVCITATRGEQGSTDSERWSTKTLGDVREKELEHAFDIMGVTEHHWLGYPDGGCPNVDESTAIGRISSVINTVQPDTIFTFGPDGMTGHEDHKTMSRWTNAAIIQARPSPTPQLFHAVNSVEWYEKVGKKWDEKFNVFFNIDKPVLVPEEQADLLFKLPPDLVARKLEALRVQISQTEGLFQMVPEQELELMVNTECFMKAALPKVEQS